MIAGKWSAPQPLSTDVLNRETGTIVWPRALLDSKYVAKRTEVERLFERLAKTSGGQNNQSKIILPCNYWNIVSASSTNGGQSFQFARQPGNASYKAAAQVQRTIVVNKAAQTITFTTNPPASAVYNTSFTVAATATSGLAVTFTSSGACTNSGATYTMTNNTGTCSVIVVSDEN